MKTFRYWLSRPFWLISATLFVIGEVLMSASDLIWKADEEGDSGTVESLYMARPD